MKTDPDGYPCLAPGEVLTLSIDWATCKEFRLDIHKVAGDIREHKVGELLLSEKIILEEGKQSIECTIPYEPLDTAYSGYAFVDIYVIEKEGEEFPIDERVFVIAASENRESGI